MKSKAKKIYCFVSFIVAVFVLSSVLVLSVTGQTAYASTTDLPNNAGSLTSQQDQDMSDIRSDDVNGLSVIYNNSNGTMSATVRIVLLLTILSLAPSILIMKTSFTESSLYCISCVQRWVHRQRHRIRYLSVWRCF